MPLVHSRAPIDSWSFSNQATLFLYRTSLGGNRFGRPLTSSSGKEFHCSHDSTRGFDDVDCPTHSLGFTDKGGNEF